MVNDKDLLSFDYKKDFPLLAANDVAYLDNSATTQKPACVIEAERDFYLKHNANPLRGLYDLAMRALLCRSSSMPKASRKLFSPAILQKA